jgi:hypothetical protein
MANLTGFLALGSISALGVFTEVTGLGGYTRKAITLSPAGNGALVNAAAITFGPATGASWTGFSALAIFATASGGSPLMAWEARGQARGFVTIGKSYTIGAGDLALQSATIRSSNGAEVFLSQGYVGHAGGFLAAAAGSSVPLSNFDAAAAPTVNDDTTQGYAVGSYWRKATTGREWVCVSATAGAARWLPLQGQALPPIGEGIMPDNVGSINAAFPSTAPVKTFSPITIDGLGTWTWYIHLTTAQAAGAMRVAVYDVDEYGLPGLQIRAPIVVSLAAGAGAPVECPIAWTNPRPGRFWIMQHVAANNPQIVTPRVGDGVPGVISGTNANAGVTALLRYRTSAGAYGTDPADATGLTTGSNGSDCPVGSLVRTA